MKVKPAYLVRGDDLLLFDAVKELVDSLVGDEDPGLAVEEHDAAALGEQAAPAVLDACLTPPFLSTKRIVVVRSAGAIDADGAGRLATYLENPLDTTTLVLVGGGGTLSQKLVNAIKKVGDVVEAKAPGTEKSRAGWVSERVKAHGVRLERAAVDRLTEHLGEEVSRLGGILDALEAAYGTKENVGVEELEPFLGQAGGVAPWDLTDAIDSGDVAGALTTLHRLLDAGERRHPLVVMATLHRHFSSMLRLDGAGVTDEKSAADILGLKGSTFPARKALNRSRALGSDNIRKAIALIADADLDLRGQRGWPPELVMEVLVARLARLGAPARQRARR